MLRHAVHTFPTDEDGGFDLGCSAAVTGGHFNPTFKTAPFTPGNHDTYEVGDLSGKHGLLGLISTEVNANYVDTTASIIYDPEKGSKGSMWIVGRSIVIHKANGDRWACANIGTAGTGTIVTFPEAAGQPDGTIQLFQPSVFWDTSMIVDLAGLEAGNKWHVHSYPVPGSGDCMGTGGHFDPAGADYTGSEAPPPYEYGDLSGKWGKLNAPSLIGANDLFVNTGRGFVSDSTLPLSGSMSVLGRSIVIHRTDGTRWACADLSPRSQRAEFNIFDGPAGYIEIFSPQAGAKATISVNLQNLGSGDKGWHVHELPAPEGGYATGEACQATGAHFNPSFRSDITGLGELTKRHGPSARAAKCPGPRRPVRSAHHPWSRPPAGTQGCRLGLRQERPSCVDAGERRPPPRLAARVPAHGHWFHRAIPLAVCRYPGPFTAATVRAYYEDELVSLHGNLSVVGRSVVIHKPNGERWGCANIGPAGYGYTATFPSRGDGDEYPEGSVQFFQARTTPVHSQYTVSTQSVHSQCTASE